MSATATVEKRAVGEFTSKILKKGKYQSENTMTEPTGSIINFIIQEVITKKRDQDNGSNIQERLEKDTDKQSFNDVLTIKSAKIHERPLKDKDQAWKQHLNKENKENKEGAKDNKENTAFESVAEQFLSKTNNPENDLMSRQINKINDKMSDLSKKLKSVVKVACNKNAKESIRNISDLDLNDNFHIQGLLSENNDLRNQVLLDMKEEIDLGIFSETEDLIKNHSFDSNGKFSVIKAREFLTIAHNTQLNPAFMLDIISTAVINNEIGESKIINFYNFMLDTLDPLLSKTHIAQLYSKKNQDKLVDFIQNNINDLDITQVNFTENPSIKIVNKIFELASKQDEIREVTSKLTKIEKKKLVNALVKYTDSLTREEGLRLNNLSGEGKQTETIPFSLVIETGLENLMNSFDQKELDKLIEEELKGLDKNKELAPEQLQNIIYILDSLEPEKAGDILKKLDNKKLHALFTQLLNSEYNVKLGHLMLKIQSINPGLYNDIGKKLEAETLQIMAKMTAVAKKTENTQRKVIKTEAEPITLEGKRMKIQSLKGNPAALKKYLILQIRKLDPQMISIVEKTPELKRLVPKYTSIPVIQFMKVGYGEQRVMLGGAKLLKTINSNLDLKTVERNSFDQKTLLNLKDKLKNMTKQFEEGKITVEELKLQHKSAISNNINDIASQSIQPIKPNLSKDEIVSNLKADTKHLDKIEKYNYGQISEKEQEEAQTKAKNDAENKSKNKKLSRALDKFFGNKEQVEQKGQGIS